MRVSITNKCTGCGACSAINPQIFEIKNNHATVTVPEFDWFEDDCIDAALTCPVDAIRITD